MLRRGKTVVPPSALGILRDDQEFQRGLALLDSGKVGTRRETYSLLTGNVTQVDRKLRYRSLVFQNRGGAPIAIDLAASDEGVSAEDPAEGAADAAPAEDAEKAE